MKSRIKSNVALFNVFTTIILQIVTLINGFVIPKLILMYFGSDTNGLISSLNQFLNYITLLDGGITGIITASLYKPLVEKDYDKISTILYTSNIFYKKIGLFFVIYTVVLGMVYPFVVTTNYNFTYIFSLTIILSITLLIQYMFSLTNRIFLTADKKVYIISITQTVIIIINIIFAYISLKIFPSVHLFKLISGLLFIIQPIVYYLYIKKNYNFNSICTYNKDLLENRWDGMAINLAYFIHSSADVTLLTIFSNLTFVSIYSVHALVTSGLKQFINAISTGLAPSIGQLYAQNNEFELEKKFELYEFFNTFVIFYIFGIASLLISPFVMIYTSNIHDANYYHPYFAFVILIAEGIYLLRNPHVNLAYSAGKFKEIKKHALFEAFLNIIISILLIKKLGLLGIAIGTLCAMTYRTIFHALFTRSLIPKRKKYIFLKKIIVFSGCFALSYILSVYLFPIINYTIKNWIIHGVVYTIIYSIVFASISFIVFKDNLSQIIKYFFRRN